MPRVLLVGMLLVVFNGTTACVRFAAVTPTLTAFDGPGFRVNLYNGWRGMATDPDQWRDGKTVALISNRALEPQCDDPGDTNCGTPVAVLEQGAMLVWWLSTTCAGSSCALPEGRRLLVGGREASLVQTTSLCDGIDASSEEAYIVSVSPQRLDAIVVCARFPPAAVRGDVRRMIETVDWRTP